MRRLTLSVGLLAASALLLVPVEAGARPKQAGKAESQAERAAEGLFVETRSGKRGAQAVYLIPGLTAPAAAWDGVRPALEARHEVHTLSLAGFGGVPATDYGANFMLAQADAIAARLKAEKVKGAVLVGHSLGGSLSLMVAQRAPEAVSKVVIVDSVPFLAQWMSGGAVQTVEQAQGMAQGMRKGMSEGDWAESVARQRGALAMQSKDAAYQSQIEAWMLASDQKTVANAMGDLMALDLRPELAKISQPTLVLMAHDPGFTPLTEEMLLGFAKAQYQGLPNAEVRTVSGARHWIMHDQREAFLAAIEAFIAE